MRVGLDPALFGQHPNGSAIDAASLCVQAPSVIEIRLPADLVAGCEFVTTGVLDETTGAEGSVQLQVLTTKPRQASRGCCRAQSTVTNANGTWTSDNRSGFARHADLVNEGSAAPEAHRGRASTSSASFPGRALLHENRAGR